MSNELEKRIQLLEEKFEYQEKTIDELNEVLIDQQEHIDNLRTELTRLNERIAATDSPEIVNEPPPHY